MAGISLGACSPASSSPALPAPHATLHRVPAASSRTRRNHGVFLLGNELATVDSSRRRGDACSVMLTVGSGTPLLVGGMTPAQARAMARALVVAAEAAEAAQLRSAGPCLVKRGAA